jgi:hypothetical protein
VAIIGRDGILLSEESQLRMEDTLALELNIDLEPTRRGGFGFVLSDTVNAEDNSLLSLILESIPFSG